MILSRLSLAETKRTENKILKLDISFSTICDITCIYRFILYLILYRIALQKYNLLFHSRTLHLLY